MKRWFAPLAVLLASAVGMHALTLHFAPRLIMGRAMAVLEQRGIALHAFTATPRVTPQAQQVVRSSPDLYYALCRYDLSDPAARLDLRMAAWPAYQSLSFFDARTDNFATLRGTGQLVTTRLLPPGSTPEPGAIISPTPSGIILIRRLAPDAARHAAAAAAGKADACQLMQISR